MSKYLFAIGQKCDFVYLTGPDIVCFFMMFLIPYLLHYENNYYVTVALHRTLISFQLRVYFWCNRERY